MNFKTHQAALPLGFKACGISARIKKSSKLDLALLYSETPCVAAGVFTANRIKAAPVDLCIRILGSKRPVRAIIANSGNANCMTGAQGVRDAFDMSRSVASELGVKPHEVLVSSTGIIGRLLPMEKIKTAVPYLVSALSGGKLKDAAEAILTTDTFAKIAVKKINIGGRAVTFAGIAKGAGMIAPNMKHATMLAYILTDAAISRYALDKAASECLGPSFNAITIDGCMSTNDTAIILANGAAGNRAIGSTGNVYKVFAVALKEVCLELAKMIVRDAEGATKFIEISVRGARNGIEADRLAKSVANSNLFKCAMFGSDPNWGRIAAALGAVPSGLVWQKMDIVLNGRPVFRNGRPIAVKDAGSLKGRLVEVEINLRQGAGFARVYTSDLSYEYVRINAEYN
ncbi:MAG TPA: ornithine acetyltransferase [Candidatus Omnitrophica bacterium]|nr:ornithine acetyltransferase [Candidatus Omnitrophota bacterium]